MGKFYMVAPFLPQLRKWIQTDGAQWNHEQGAQAVEDASPTDDEQNEQNGVVLGDAYSTNEPAAYQDSSASLRSLLGIHAESAVDPVASQADAAAKLKSLLSIGPAAESTQPSNISANGQILLSLLQSGPTPKKSEPQARANPRMTQAPVTPTQANAPVVASPHSTVSHHSGVSRKPLTPLYDTPLAQPPTVYASPGYKASKAPAPVKTTGPYAQAAPPANALLSSLQSQAKPITITEQATALLKTLTSANSPPRQSQSQATPVPSPLDVFFAQKPKPAPDTQQKLSLLSILKGESQPAPTAAPVQEDKSVPITPVTPIAQTQAPQHQLPPPPPPPPPPPRHQTPPVTTDVKNIARSPATRSPATKREKHPASPRGPRAQRAARNGSLPKQTPAARPLPMAPTKEVPPVLQAPQKRITPPLEPYMSSPVSRVAGVALNGFPPVLARGTTDPMFDRRDTANQQQQQTLLALFKKPSVSTLKQEVKVTPVATANVGSPVAESSGSATARLQAAVRKIQSQQVPPMKTGGGVSLGKNSGERAATSPRSPLVPGGAEAFAKDAFLMSYLEGVAKGAGK